MNLHEFQAQFITRRHFLRKCNSGIGAVALAALLGTRALGEMPSGRNDPLVPKAPPLLGKAKRVIYLSMSGAPPQHEVGRNASNPRWI